MKKKFLIRVLAILAAIVVVMSVSVTASEAAPTEEKFRVGPTVVLRPVVDVIEKGQDGIVELYLDNPLLNDVVLHLDAHIIIPAGIHIYSEQYAWATAAGVAYAPAFEISPGTARTISIHVKADETARLGPYTLHFSGLYYPGTNKDLYNPISLTYPIEVKEPSMKATLTPTPMLTPQEPTEFRWSTWQWLIPVIIAAIACIVGIARLIIILSRRHP